MTAPLWKLAIGRLMGWTPAEARAVEEALRASPGVALRGLAGAARDVAAEMLVGIADTALIAERIVAAMNARCALRQADEEIDTLRRAMGWPERAPAHAVVKAAVIRIAGLDRSSNSATVQSESKWPCFWCGSMQAHETGYPGGMSTVPACAEHAAEYTREKSMQVQKEVMARVPTSPTRAEAIAWAKEGEPAPEGPLAWQAEPDPVATFDAWAKGSRFTEEERTTSATVVDEAEDPLTPSERASMATPEARATCCAVKSGTGGGVACELPVHHAGDHREGDRQWPAEKRRASDAIPLVLADFRAAARRWLEGEHVRASHRENGVLVATLTDLLKDTYEDGVAVGRSTDYPTRGHRINRKATIGARIVELDILIPEVEKRSRKTPPKTLLAEKERVETAKAMLPKLVAERGELMLERVELEAILAIEAAQKRSDGPGEKR